MKKIFILTALLNVLISLNTQASQSANQVISQAIREFNANSVNIRMFDNLSALSSRDSDSVYDNTENQYVMAIINQQSNELCQKIEPVLPPGYFCDDIIKIEFKQSLKTEKRFVFDPAGLIAGIITIGFHGEAFPNKWERAGYVTLKATVTEEGRKALRGIRE